MPLHWSDLPPAVLEALRAGTVIVGHPLALDGRREFDRQSQRALTRYYLDAGAGGLAVAVHATQFGVREVGLHRPVLELAAETARAWTERPVVMVAGVLGRTAQAVEEARLAASLGYHAGLLSLGAMPRASERELIEHCATVAAEMPLIGLYLPRSVGGAALSRGFWARFAALDNAVAVKVAPFDRYAALEVAFGVVAAGAEERVTLYTGNDDHIVPDLLTPLAIRAGGRHATLRFRGAMLAYWSVWTRSAVALFKRLREAWGRPIPPELLAIDGIVTDCSGVILDVGNTFAGCIPGCHEILRRQGLMRSAHCLNPDETLSPGQAEAIERLYATYPEWADDAFVAQNLARWRA